MNSSHSSQLVTFWMQSVQYLFNMLKNCTSTKQEKLRFSCADRKDL